MNGSRGRQRRPVWLLALLCLLLPFPASGATTRYVDVATSASGDGLSWQTAKKTIQEAVDAASPGDEIWVAEGDYLEQVTLGADLSLYGGFSRTETDVGQRDLARHSTRVVGPGGGSNFDLMIPGADLVLDGFASEHGTWGLRASGRSGKYSIRNCRFSHNVFGCVLYGTVHERPSCEVVNSEFTQNTPSGLYGQNLDGCTIHNCTFDGNISTSDFGTLYLYGCAQGTVSGCIIRNNVLRSTTSGYGAGIQIGGGAVTVDGCVITGNIAESMGVVRSHGYGGGIYFLSRGAVTNCVIANNSGDRGGGVCLFGGAVTNCVIANNRADYGAGVYCLSGSEQSPLPVTNCAIVGNAAGSDGGGVYCEAAVIYYPHYPPVYVPSYASVTNCLFSNNTPNVIESDGWSHVTQMNNLVGGDPGFVNAAAGNYHLLPNSAAIDRGTTVPLTADYDGAPRPVDIPGVGADHTGAEFDIGAYEYQFVAPPVPPSLSGAVDAGGGEVGLTWTDDNGTTPAQYLAFAYDVYAAQFTPRGSVGTMWYPFLPPAHSGPMAVAQTGAYFAWISDQWWDGTWLPCLNPAALIVYSGIPHAPTGLSVEDRGGGVWRLHWNPEIYGTWLDQIIVYQNGVGWIAPTDGPSSAYPQFAPWTFLDYGGLAYDSSKADFFAGWADFTLPPGGSFVFFLNFKAWDAATAGPFVFAATP